MYVFLKLNVNTIRKSINYNITQVLCIILCGENLIIKLKPKHKEIILQLTTSWLFLMYLILYLFVIAVGLVEILLLL